MYLVLTHFNFQCYNYEHEIPTTLTFGFIRYDANLFIISFKS